MLDAIVEPRRRAILRLLRSQEMLAGAIAAHFSDVSRPTVSEHIRVLREAGLLDERREGTRRFYRARVEGLAEVSEFIEELWDASLGTLKVEAEREQRRRDGRQR